MITARHKPKTTLKPLLLILCLAAWLRFDALTHDARFHVDEAFFATFARGAAVQGDWLLGGALDKPPLAIYASALGMQAFGIVTNAAGVLDLDLYVGEFAARVPHAFAGVILTALVYALARALAPRRESFALGAALLTGLSPLAVSLNAAGFTDTFMLLFVLAALNAAARGRGAWAGVMLALAFASKQQGLYVAPLVLALLWTHAPRRAGVWVRAGVAFGAGVSLLLVWDAARIESSIFALAAANNDPVRLLPRLDELPERLSAWAGFIAAAFGGGLVAGGVSLAALRSLRGAPRGVRWVTLWAILYLALHIGIRFNTYDRYALPLVPLVSIGAAWTLSRLPARVLYAVLMGLAVWLTLNQAPFPQDTRWRDRDFPALMSHLNAKPLGTIIYDPWLGWYTGYYVGAWSDKRRVHYPDAESLVRDAPLNPDRAPRYLIAPRDVDISGWLEALTTHGFAPRVDYTNAGFVAYQLALP